MTALFLLIGISLLVASAFLVAFLWSVQNGQFDDTQTPPVRILFDRAGAHPKLKTKGDKGHLKKA